MSFWFAILLNKYIDVKFRKFFNQNGECKPFNQTCTLYATAFGTKPQLYGNKYKQALGRAIMFSKETNTPK